MPESSIAAKKCVANCPYSTSLVRPVVAVRAGGGGPFNEARDLLVGDR